MRALYTLLLYLSLPAVLLRLWLRGARLPGYRRHWNERFGFAPRRVAQGAVWVHAVSVGEVRAAEPLVRALGQRGPGCRVLLTTTTPTGRATAERLFGNDVDCVYLPWDLPAAVRRFLERTRPRAALIIETELWPNLFHALARRQIPLVLVNARLSPSSLRGYLRFRSLAAATLRCVDAIAAQSPQDAEAFARLGAAESRLHLVGQLKFDARLPEDFDERTEKMRQRPGARRRLWVAGSTHAGEEQTVLAAHKRVLQACPDVLLVLVPRHPERVEEVIALCKREKLRCRLISEKDALEAEVVVVDVLGELVYLYGIAAVAFLGGSLVARGGQNPLEAILSAVPVLIGPSVYNFSGVYEQLLAAGAARLIDDDVSLAAGLCDWLNDEAARQQAGEAGLEVIGQNRGAVQRTLNLLEGLGVGPR